MNGKYYGDTVLKDGPTRFRNLLFILRACMKAQSRSPDISSKT